MSITENHKQGNRAAKDGSDTEGPISLVTTAISGATGGAMIGGATCGVAGALIGGLIGSVISGYSDYRHHHHITHGRSSFSRKHKKP